MKTVQELMNPRYKVIANYPISEFTVGDLLQISEFNVPPLFYIGIKDGNDIHIWMTEDNLQEFPHLFKKLEWWEGRSLQDMPKYIIGLNRGDKHYREVERWDMRDGTLSPKATLKGFDYYGSYIIPITEQEYNEYILTIHP